MSLIFKNEYLRKELKSCVEKYENIYIAVAWAKYAKNDFSEKLKLKKDNIKKLIVGVEREITDLEFLIKFKDKVKVIPKNNELLHQDNGLFHPKIYLFTNKDESKWSLFIGSANLTYSALNKNTEAMVCLTEENSSAETLKQIKAQFNKYEKDASEIDGEFLKNYEYLYKKRKKLEKEKTFYDDYAKTSLYKLSWEDYSNTVKRRHSNGKEWYPERIELIKIANKYLSDLDNINEDAFKALLGLKKWHENKNTINKTNINWHHFGHMRVSRKIDYTNLRQRAKIALDCINTQGPIKKEDYEEYMDIMLKDGIGIAIATRLLALKRPDIFLCVTGQNVHRLKKDFGYKDGDRNSYWNMIDVQFKKCNWYKDKKAAIKDSSLWKNRAAMLDTILYCGEA